MSETLSNAKPGSVVRQRTQDVKEHIGALERAKDIYYADLARARAKYYDAVNRIHEAMTDATAPVAAETNGHATTTGDANRAGPE